MALFGENFASHLEKHRRKQLEEFDSLASEPSLCRRNERVVYITPPQKMEKKAETKKAKQNEAEDEEIEEEEEAEVEEEEDEEQGQEEEEKGESEDLENEGEQILVDSRSQTIFRTSKTRGNRKIEDKENPFHKKKYGDIREELKNQRIENVRVKSNPELTRQKKLKQLKEEDKNPFLTQKKMRELYLIDRTKDNQGQLRYDSDVHKIARNNIRFLESITMRGQMYENAEDKARFKDKNNNYKIEKRINRRNVLFSKTKFKQRLRYNSGVSRGYKHPKPYAEFRRQMQNKEATFKRKKDVYLKRELRVLEKQEVKSLAKKIWSA
ncbi:DNA ligase I [Reticulomyxa filosa]|uniref:DNA ligase I n=1 Tax=Reticulomyxa filosa TaxID=46433 RepID=X6NSK1_RETFI|nr:DNA ligase I [Reticulomyxa filosa]|eukprot:ETO28302.1 DNA ligase I [Reticulomyxa filosa]